MFEKIEYFAPYFNNTNALREAYGKLYPTATFDQISSMMVGALSVYVPDVKFDKLVSDTLAEATAKMSVA